MTQILKMQDRHMMHLAIRDADPDGWAKVSAPVMRVIHGEFDDALVEFRRNEDGSGAMRVTDLGKIVLEYVSKAVRYAQRHER